MGLLDDAVSAGQDAVDSGVDAVQGAGDAATDAAGDATDAAGGAWDFGAGGTSDVIDDAVSGATDAGEGYWNLSEDVADAATFGLASDLQDWEQSTRDDRWEAYFGDAADSGGFLERAYGAADSWLALGAAPGGADVIGSGVVDDVLGGGGDNGDGNGNGNGDGGPGLPSWLLPAAVVAAAGAYLVYGGEI